MLNRNNRKEAIKWKEASEERKNESDDSSEERKNESVNSGSGDVVCRKEEDHRTREGKQPSPKRARGKKKHRQGDATLH
jgi:hypothetical protein